MTRTWARLLVLALLLALALGCAPAGQEEEPGLKLWFPTGPARERLSSALDTCPYQGEERSIPALLSALLAGPPSEEAELVPAVHAGTRVLSWSLDSRVVYVELSSAYAELVGVELTLADCCITLTLTQLPGVDGVRVTASGGGQSYRERQVLYPEDVLFTGAEEVPVEVTAALYFRREGGDSLGYELRKFRLTEDKLPVKAVLAALIAGPEDKGLSPLIPQEVTVRAAWVDEGVCCADFSAQLLEVPEQERALAAQSIVGTLCSMDTVNQVQILVEGEPAPEFGGADLSRAAPFGDE